MARRLPARGGAGLRHQPRRQLGRPTGSAVARVCADSDLRQHRQPEVRAPMRVRARRERRADHRGDPHGRRRSGSRPSSALLLLRAVRPHEPSTGRRERRPVHRQRHPPPVRRAACRVLHHLPPQRALLFGDVPANTPVHPRPARPTQRYDIRWPRSARPHHRNCAAPAGSWHRLLGHVWPDRGQWSHQRPPARGVPLGHRLCWIPASRRSRLDPGTGHQRGRRGPRQRPGQHARLRHEPG